MEEEEEEGAKQSLAVKSKQHPRKTMIWRMRKGKERRTKVWLNE